MSEPWQMSRVINRIRLAAGGIVTSGELIEAIYPDPDLEPDDAANWLRTLISKLRRHGFPIENFYGEGYRFAPTFHEISVSGSGAD